MGPENTGLPVQLVQLRRSRSRWDKQDAVSPNIRVIRVPCSGRVNPYFIIKALQRGWDGILVSGCHPGDCHYISGNLVARRRFAVLKDLLEYLGIEPGRVNFSWVSAAEGEKFANDVKDVVEKVKTLGPAERLVKR